MAWHLYARGSASGVYLQNAPLFPTNLPADIRWGFDAIWNVSIISTTQAIFEFTVDGGVTWFPLNPIAGVNSAIPADDERTFNIKATDKELFNLRCTDVAGCTLYRVLVSIAPQDIMRPRSDLDINVPNPLPVDICPVSCDVPIVNGTTPLIVSNGSPVGTPAGATILNISNTAILANTDISVTDLSPTGTSVGDSVIFRILWSSNSAGRLRFTLNGTDFVDFNNSINLKGGAASLFDIVVDHTDLFNLQFSNATTITFLRVIQVI